MKTAFAEVPQTGGKPTCQEELCILTSAINRRKIENDDYKSINKTKRSMAKNRMV